MLQDQAIDAPEHDPAAPPRGPVWVCGLPFSPLRHDEAIREIERRIDARIPSYYVSANLNYAMLTHRHEDVRQINRDAALVLVDGMPLLWLAALRGTPLPERVAGSDLIFGLCDLAARRGYRVLMLGGAPGVAEEAGRRLAERSPGLSIVGAISPPFRAMSAEETEALLDEIRGTRPDLILAAFSQPNGERWIYQHFQAVGPVSWVQMGAAIDFAAGRVRRAPRWCREVGLEWAFRLALEPRRLAGRYFRNGLFLAGAFARELAARRGCHVGP